MKILNTLKATLILFPIVFSASITPNTASAASMLDMPQVPMPINVGATANIFLSIDDSGSMDREILAPLHYSTCLYNADLSCSTGVMFENIYDQENPVSTQVSSPPADACALWDANCNGVCDIAENCTAACEGWDLDCDGVCDLNEGGGDWDVNCNSFCDTGETCSQVCEPWDANCDGICDFNERAESWDTNCNGACDVDETCQVQNCQAWDDDCDGICDDSDWYFSEYYGNEVCPTGCSTGGTCSTVVCATWDTDCDGVCDSSEGGGDWDTNCNNTCDTGETCGTCAPWDDDCDGVCDDSDYYWSSYYGDENCPSNCDTGDSCVCESWDLDCDGSCDYNEGGGGWDTDCDGICDSTWFGGEDCPVGCNSGETCTPTVCEAWDIDCDGRCDSDEGGGSWDTNCNYTCDTGEGAGAWDLDCDSICDADEGGGSWDTDCDGSCDWSEGGGSWDTNCNYTCDLNEGAGEWDTDCDSVCDAAEGGGAWDTNCNSTCDTDEGGGAWDTDCDAVCDAEERTQPWDTDCDMICDDAEGGGAWDTDCDSVCDAEEGAGAWDTNCNLACDTGESCTDDCLTWDVNCNATCDTGEACGDCAAWDDDCDGVCDDGYYSWLPYHGDENCPSGCDTGETCPVCEAWDTDCDGYCDSDEGGGSWDDDCDSICDSGWPDYENCPSSCSDGEPCSCAPWDNDCDGVCNDGWPDYESCPAGCNDGETCAPCADWDTDCDGVCESGEQCVPPEESECLSWDTDCDNVCDDSYYSWSSYYGNENCPSGCDTGDTCACESWANWDEDCDGRCDWDENCPAACGSGDACVCEQWDEDCDGICDGGWPYYESCPSGCSTGDPCTQSVSGEIPGLVISLVPLASEDENPDERNRIEADYTPVMDSYEYIFANSDNTYSSACGNAYEACESADNQDWFDWRARSSSLNVMYFDPQVHYQPWVGYLNADFAAARSQPVSGNDGYSNTRNLAGFVYHVWIDDRGFTGTAPNKTNATSMRNDIVDQWDSHIKVKVDASGFSCKMFNYYPNSSGMNTVITDMTTAECSGALGINGSLAELQQNVANWYQYYRKRALATKAAVATVVTNNPDFRYGLGLINDTNVFVEMPPDSTTDYSSHNQSVIGAYLGDEQQHYYTPLRRGLERVGNYYSGRLSGRGSPITQMCQQCFTIQFTDGFWNRYEPTYPSNDFDGDGGRIDSDDVLLADVAKYFYDTDLSPLANVVPTTAWDTASHQHMVTYTIGFGLFGSLSDTDGDGWPNNFDPYTYTGPWYVSGTTDEQKKVDDLWHTAWNGRGDYYSARNPEELTLALGDAIKRIGDRVGTSASAVGNGSTLSTLFQVFKAKFDSDDWSGQLQAIGVDQNTGQIGSTNWEAGAWLDAQAETWFTATTGGRKIFTWDPVTHAGLNFQWSSLTAPQQAGLDANPMTAAYDGQGEARLKYIRGSRLNEGSGNNYRERNHRLGDMVHSDLQYVGPSPFFYGFDDYQTFRTDNVNRQGVVYAGANDGMLHAFREDTGAEIFAYVPDYLIGKLGQLTRPDYDHTWYMDGPLDYGDVYYNNAWKSVLVGSLRGGGQAVYALDITDPLNFSASNVLWEFSDLDDVDMGYVVGRPQIKKMANGKWAAIFGSGYNSPEPDGQASATGDAYVFVLFIEDGIDGWSAGDYVKIPVPGADGLTSPSVADVDGDSQADFLYLGDLNGNMWKIDVTSETPSSWGVAFSGNPLFTATSSSGGLQPITSRPSIKTHPYGISHGALVLFGTGKYLEVSDDVVDGQPTQSVYGIWDRDAFFHRTEDTTDTDPRNNYGEYGFARTSLTSSDVTIDGTSGRRVIDPDTFTAPQWYDQDGNPLDRGWMIDLPVQGERVVQRTVIRDDLLYFVTMIPEPNVCAPGSSGWLMVLDAQTGGTPVFPVFDINNDLIVDSDDILTVGDPLDPDQTGAAGVQMPSMPNLPLFVYEDKPAGSSSSWSNFPPTPNASRGCSAAGARTFTYTTQADGNIAMVVSASQPLICGRQSWMQYE